MNIRWWAAALAMCVVLTACNWPSDQLPGEAASSKPASVDSAITPEDVASLPPTESRPAVNRLANEVVAAETGVCQENPDVDWEACVSARMLAGFDRYGFLASHCRMQADLETVRDCVLFGRSGIDWLLAIGGNPDTDFDWSKPEQSNQQALTKLNDVLTERCAGKPEQAGDSCFTRLSAEVLGLGDVVDARCAARIALAQRGACIVDAHDAAMYQVALATLGK